ncbi:hypothetical protein V2J09_001370 [Rumex salicifolius]
MEVMRMRCENKAAEAAALSSPLLISRCFSPSDHHHYHQVNACATPPSSSPLPPEGSHVAAIVVASPCAACKILRRRCSAEKCVLAPYFPPTDPIKFATAHKVFGASNIIKLLQELPESQRADAVSSMVYEANARLRDPVYGSAGAICHLQKQLSQLQAELAKAQAELLNMKCQQSNLLAMLCNNNSHYYSSNITTANNTMSAELDKLPMVSLSSSTDNSDLDSPMSDPDGFFNFYPDTSDCTLITWDMP